MANDVLVKVDNLSKKYCTNLKQSLWYAVSDISNSISCRRAAGDRLRENEFWALKNISFELKRGDCLGILGPNGAGKSTLLKLLTGLIRPDTGEVGINGKTTALMDLSAGFDPLMTGRENIYLYASILGMERKAIEKSVDQIIEFSELGKNIDTPVHNYSSGMKVRLGFSIAVQLKPDILFIDEVLAVGDVGFKAKCFNKIANIADEVAMIFVSHSIPQITRASNRICILNKGEIEFLGNDVGKGIQQYNELFKKNNEIITGNNKAKLISLELMKDGKIADEFEYGEKMEIFLGLCVDKEISKPIVNITILNQFLDIVAQCDSSFNDIDINNPGGEILMGITLDNILLNPGIYYLSISIMDKDRYQTLIQHYASRCFKVRGPNLGIAPLLLKASWEISNRSFKQDAL